MSAIKARLGKFATVDDFVEGYAQYFFRGGILLPTRQERAEGESVSLHLKVADGTSVLRAEGVVKQTRLNSQGRPVGLVIRFSKLDASSKDVVDRIMDAKRNTPASGSMQAVPLNAQGKNRLRDNTTGQHLAVKDIAAIADAIDDTFDSIFSEGSLPAGGDGPMAGASDEYLASLGDLGAFATPSAPSGAQPVAEPSAPSATPAAAAPSSPSGTQPVAAEQESAAPRAATSDTLEHPDFGEDSTPSAAVLKSLRPSSSTPVVPLSSPGATPGVPARPDTPLSLIAEASGASERIPAVDTSETTIQRPTDGDAIAFDSAELDAADDEALSTPPQLSLPEDDAEHEHPAVSTVQSRPVAPDDELDVADVFAKARAEAQSRGESTTEAAVGGASGEEDALSLEFIDSTLDEPPRREGQVTKDSKAILEALSSANQPATPDQPSPSFPVPQAASEASSTVFGMPAFDANTTNDAGAQSLAKMELKKQKAQAGAALESPEAGAEQGERVKDFIAALTEGSGAQSAVSAGPHVGPALGESATAASGGHPATGARRPSDMLDALSVSGSVPAIESGDSQALSGDMPFAATMAMNTGSDEFVESVADRVASANVGEAALDELLGGEEPEREASAAYAPPPMQLERSEPAGPLQRFVAWIKGLFGM